MMIKVAMLLVTTASITACCDVMVSLELTEIVRVKCGKPYENIQ